MSRKSDGKPIDEANEVSYAGPQIMLREIEQLLIIQDRDQRIKKLRHDQQSLPSERRKLGGKVELARQTLEAARQRLRESEVARRKLELEVEGKRDAIARFKQQQQQTRKNEEYQALAHEIDHFERDIRTLEDRELEHMEASERLQQPIVLAEAEYSRVEKSTADQLEKLELGSVGIQERLVELEAARAETAATISMEVLDLYDRLFAKKGDVAVVPVEGEVCGGCHVRAPAQTLIQLRGNKQLTQCPNCGRILYRPA